MPLFGPLGSVMYGDAPLGASSGWFGADPQAADYAMRIGVQRPRTIPNLYELGIYQSPATPTNTAPAPLTPAAAVAPPPALPSIMSMGTFTTRRTQLFGPLSAVSI